MRAHKRNPFWGEGLDKRQARRMRRRLGRGQWPKPKGGHVLLLDEFALNDPITEFAESLGLFERRFETEHKPITHAYLGVGQPLPKEDA